MRKLKYLCSALLFLNLYSTHLLCQVADSVNYKKPRSFLEIFADTGIVIEKTYIPLGKIKEMEFEFIQIKNMLNGVSVYGMKASKISRGSLGNIIYDYSTFIDSDELKTLMIACDTILKIVKNPMPKYYTEILFSTRSDFTTGIFVNDNGKYKGFTETNKLYKDSWQKMDVDEFTNIYLFAKNAYDYIQSK